MVDIAPFVRTDFKTVDKRDELGTVKAWVTADSTKRPIILDQERAFGIVNERALMGRHMDTHARVGQFTLATRALLASASLEQARARMAELHAAYLPVEDDAGKLIGYVAALDIARDAGLDQRAGELAAPVTLLREDQTLGDALNTFAKEYVEFLPVVGQDGRLTGVLSRASILRVEFNNGDRGRKDAGGEKMRILDGPVSGFMERGASVMPATASFDALVRAIEANGYAVVGEGTRIRGIATAETLLRPPRK